MTVFLCFSETAEAFPLPPGWTRISPFLVSDSAPGLDLWAALLPSLYLLALSINHQVEETAFCYRPIIRLFFCFCFFFLPSFT